MTVENLNINVKTNARTAAKNLNSLANALNNVRTAANSLKPAPNSLNKVGDAAKKATKHTNDFASSLLRIAKYRFMRTIIKSITSAFSEGLEKAYFFSSGIAGEGNRFAAALDQMKSSGNAMKGQLGSAFISLLAAIQPILEQIIALITKVADAISQLFAAITGNTYLKAVATTAKFAKATQSGAKAAKEWKNQLLGFDEINRLEEPSNGSGGSGTNPLEGYNFQDTPLSDWAKKIQENLALIELTASGFLLGLGCLLLFSGANIPLGLALIAVGAAGFAQALQEDWSSVDSKIAHAVAAVMEVLGGALLAIGALLTFTGANIPLGLGLMVAGAVAFATAAGIDWKVMQKSIKSVVAEIAVILGASLLALGAIIAFAIPGMQALGLGLLAAGCASIMAGMAIDWDWLSANIKGVITKILLVLGGALLALGIILVLATPAFSPLGVALIAAGASSLAAAAAVNWDSLPTKIKNVVADIMAILGASLVVLGVILCLTGAGIPLGLGLILAGAASFATALSFDAGAIITAVKGACDHIWSIVSGLFQGIHDWIQNLINGICSFLGLASVGSQAQKIQNDGSIYLTGFASGGFPTPGQLFVANDAGPELVGTMGGRTAVASNQDILEGIRQGVYEAVTAANGSGDKPVEVRVFLDSREIKSGQNRLSRAVGV